MVPGVVSPSMSSIASPTSWMNSSSVGGLWNVLSAPMSSARCRSRAASEDVRMPTGTPTRTGALRTARQYIKALVPRQFQVEQNQIRWGAIRFGKFLDRLFAVFVAGQLVGDMMIVEGFFEQVHVSGIVLNGARCGLLPRFVLCSPWP